MRVCGEVGFKSEGEKSKAEVSICLNAERRGVRIMGARESSVGAGGGRVKGMSRPKTGCETVTKAEKQAGTSRYMACEEAHGLGWLGLQLTPQKRPYQHFRILAITSIITGARCF